MRIAHVTLALLGAGLVADGAMAQWVTFQNESSSRIISDTSVGLGDTQEKDYCWADFDQDGDVDVICVRKQIASTPGRRRNVLFMNENIADGQGLNGVLVDRSDELASAATDGGDGFLDLTNDRDVIAVDVNNDGWIDVVTAVTYGDGLPKSISHHRVYINLGEVGGVWQGFRYEEARIPQLQEAPDACGVAAGDVTGDGFADLYFVTYNSSFEDHLLINDGNGFFTDETSSRMSAAMVQSSFGSACHAADMNGDGWLDIVKSENGPVKIIYNGGNGFFNQFETASSGAHYHVDVADLNNDGKMDMVIADDGADPYKLNIGNGGDGMANFATFTAQEPVETGFNGNMPTGDLDNDGFIDVIWTDIDVDAPDCVGPASILHNLGNVPNVTLIEPAGGDNIPNSSLNGVHDVAMVDLNGDNWLDLVIGHCTGTEIWVNQPPIGLLFNYPEGLPIYIDPETGVNVRLLLEPIGDANPIPSSVKLFLSINGEPFSEIGMTQVGTDLYEAAIPATDCGSSLDFYFAADLDTGGTFTDPPTAPAGTFMATSALGTEVMVEEEFEEDATTWTVASDGLPTDTGQWEQVEPIPTFFNGQPASPEEDGSPGHEKVRAFITQNGEEGNPSPSDADVDGGPFHLISPTLDMSGEGDSTITFKRWHYSEGGGTHIPDEMLVSISADDGQTWVPVPELGTFGTNGAWESVAFLPSDYIELTSTVRVRFTTSDVPNNSITESGIDDFRIEALDCGEVVTPCPADLNGDGVTDVVDLVEVILDWGCAGVSCTGDVNGDEVVDVQDLVQLILEFGPCP